MDYSGPCTVRGERAKYKIANQNGELDYKYDFYIFFLDGDCDGTEEETITIKRETKHWRKTLYITDEDLVEEVPVDNE